MYWMFYIAAAAVVALLFFVGFLTPYDIKGDMNWKQWLQVVGGGIMCGSILTRHLEFHFDRKGFVIGALIFASSFLTWKRQRP
jgi:hypothetical protein